MQTPTPHGSREPSPFTRSRSVSVSSDMTSRNFQSTPPSVDPSPAYIAASEASQIVSVELEQNALIPIPDDGNDLVSVGSLALLNAFLDYLLFNILAVAKSTQLNDLRPAITDVLKPRLAKEVVSAAQDELRDYMGGDPEDELQEFRGGQKPNGEFDLVRAWKLTRLRCMVYTRLGNMEEEEEAEYIALEALDDPNGTPRRFSNHTGNITPAAAIFLTSIIEFLGEHALVVAGENAGNRLTSIRANREDINIRVTVEEVDMEKLALNSTLGRLWRTWKMRVRPPTLSRTLSRESFSRRAFSSTPTVDESITQDPPHEEPLEEEKAQETPLDPADIALPINDNDVNEIEIPGLWVDPESSTDADATVAPLIRARSLCHQSTRPPESSPHLNTPGHHRSRSLPSHVFKKMPSELKSSEASEEEEKEEEKEDGTAAAQDVQNDTQPEVDNPRAASKAESLEILERKSQGLGIVGEANATKEEVSEGARNSQLVEAQVVEGQGTYQVPKLSSITRPRRKSTKESRPKDVSASDSDVPTSYRDDHPPPMQGAATTPHVKPNLIYAKANYLDDRSRSHLPAASAPTSHPRQLDTNPEGSTEDLSDDRTRRSFNASRRTPSLYTESIAPPRSISEGSEGSIYRSRTPSYAASHAPSPNGQYRQNLGDNSPGRERAAVQRVHLGSTTSQASTKSRRSESISEKRPQTSGSTTSTVSNKWKLLIGRHPAEADVPLPGRPRLSSEASTPVEDVADEPSLDDLIKSDETIRFTLTPRNMRQMESPSSPRYNTARNDLLHERSGTAELADFLKTTAPPGEQRSPVSPVDRPLPSPSVSTSNPPVNGLRAHPPDPSTLPPASPASLGSSRSRGTMYQARDARTTGNSVRDFADFIRSTGPSGASPTSASRPSGSSLRGHYRNDSTSAISASAIARPDTAQSGSSRTTAKPGDALSPPRKNPQRLQARDPAGNAGSKTSDLIDFIREGPPGAYTHRIPRTVAPFRNTMDSEELMSMDTATSNATSVTSVSPSLASTRAESANFASNHSITSSRAPLLENNNPSDAPPPIPPRKRRGPRDPYAIDDSDDDLEDLAEAPKTVANPPRKEESMLDFLNSVPPPTSDKPPEPFILSSNPVPPKSSSGSSGLGLKGRFRRNSSVDKFVLSKKSTTSMRSARVLNDSSKIPAVPHVSTTVSSPTSRMGGQSGKLPAGHSGFVAHSGQGPKAANQTAAPSARSTRPTETSALADFLKNTGPPEPPVRASTAMSEEKKDSTFSKIFRRRKVDY